MRYYIFLLQGSWRTRDIKAHTLKQAFSKAGEEYGKEKVLGLYQTASLTATTFSGWKQLETPIK